MFKIILARLQQGHRTIKYPYGPPPKLSDRFRGRPIRDAAQCAKCGECAKVCPTDAIGPEGIDLGRCFVLRGM